MKNIFKKQLLIAIPLAFTLSGCSDFLDKLPENSVEAESVDYSKTSEMYMPVSGIYAKVRSNLAGWSGWGCIIVRGDDVNKGGSPTDQVEYNYCSNFEYEKLKTFWALNGTWGSYYNTISLSNSALESLAKYAEHLKNDSDKALNTKYLSLIHI